MQLHKIFSLLVLLSLLVFSPSSIVTSLAVPISTSTQPEAQPSDLGEWQTGPYPPNNFQYARHDGAFVSGPALESWANKIYFLGGRTSPPTESPNIWMFDPVTGIYTDTGADVYEDVSNYNANLILDDGTGRGPAIYVIGGTDKDHGGASIGTVQRYYPQTNEAEALNSIDDWNGKVNGYRVAAMGTAVVNDIIYVYGGWETSSAPYFSSQTWAFDPKQPAGSRWFNLGIPLSTPRSYIMSAVQNGKVYAIGGVGFYDGNDLGPVDALEVLDPANLAAGWTSLSPMPAPGGEGRAFGFDYDTLKVNSPYQGKLYVVAPNDWPGVSGEVLEYDVISDTWRSDLPELPTPRADLAGTFVPLCTSDPNDGLPGIWTFGGRVNESCDPPLGPTEYAPMTCESVCTPLTDVAISGPTQLLVGETGVYTASILPVDASAPVTLLWDNDDTTPETTYTWDQPGTYTVEITSTNCDGSAVVTDTLVVEVTPLCTPLTGVEIDGPANLPVGEAGLYSVTLSPITATKPLDILWSNGFTGTQATFSWFEPGLYDVSVTASNCGGSAVVTDTLSVEVSSVCIPLTEAEIAGPTQLLVGETGLYSVTLTPISATLPIEILWSNGITESQASYSWSEPGVYTISITVMNCDGIVVTATLEVEVLRPNLQTWLPLIVRH